MKKGLLWASAALVLGVFAGITTTTAHAADAIDTLNNNSTATFNVKQAEGGATLKLAAVPSFVFTEISQSDWVKAETKTLTDSISGNLTITDYRATGTGWTLATKVGQFNHDGNDDAVTATAFKLTADKPITGDDFNGTLAKDTDLIDNAALLVATGDANMTGAGKTDSDFKDDQAELTLPKHVTAKSGTYTATIDWTLGAAGAVTPKAK